MLTSFRRSTAVLFCSSRFLFDASNRKSRSKFKTTQTPKHRQNTHTYKAQIICKANNNNNIDENSNNIRSNIFLSFQPKTYIQQNATKKYTKKRLNRNNNKHQNQNINGKSNSRYIHQNPPPSSSYKYTRYGNSTNSPSSSCL